MIYTTYDPASGGITGIINTSSTNNIDPDVKYIAGAYDAKVYYIKNGKAVAYPPKPNDNFWIVYIWDMATETWYPNNSATAKVARRIRDEKLVAVDRVNPMWWASMTAEQQVQVSAYRQELLNVTKQPGFPTVIEWPDKPVWL